jgi:ELWxxDGT repeat protein
LLATVLASCAGGGGERVTPALPSVAYFMGSDGTYGWELWKTDGTAAGTMMVKDINPGAGDGFLSPFTVLNSALYFSATDGVTGYELWKTDGTAAGTVMVKDINPGAGDSYPGGFIRFNLQFPVACYGVTLCVKLGA